MVGCGPLPKYLPNLLPLVEEQSMNLSTSFDGEQLAFKCKPGLHGNPVATCMSKRWSLSDPCERFLTSRGCQCKQSWTYCEGWFFTDCKVHNGCSGLDSQGTAWCTIEPGSCPQSAQLLFG